MRHTNEQGVKPPIGLTPRWLLKEKRIQDILDAIHRYVAVNKKIPLEWIVEYNELAKED